MDSSFKKAAIAVPKLSGFDKSHQNLLTSKVGTITPILVDELIPGTKVNLKLALNAQLPPLASDTFMRCSIKTEAFFVPMRLLSGAFESFFTDNSKDLIDSIDGQDITTETFKGFLPVIKDTTGQSVAPTGELAKIGLAGTLSDYLGYKKSGYPNFIKYGISAMPFLAYHRIYNDFYRNSLVQKECFVPRYYHSDALSCAASAPFDFHTSEDYIWDSDGKLRLADGEFLTELRQRNFGLDYFTAATPTPQQGDAQVVSFDTSGSTGNFSIAALRAANSMQQFKERNNLLGNLYVEQVYGRYGVRPSDGIAQRSIYLGRGEFEVYSKGIFQTSNNNIQGDTDGSYTVDENPFGTVGTRFGSAYASGSNFVVNFEAKEPGYLFVNATLVPRVTYSTGVRRYLKHYIGDGSLSDMANPILQNVGPQPIYEYEVNRNTTNDYQVFGYTDRYAEFKTMEDELHGLLRDGETLRMFALQRTIAATTGTVNINSSFLRIPTNYMDNVSAVNGSLSNYGYWLDTYFDYKVAMPLSKYSLPSLQDPAYEHGKTIVVSKGGSKL